jgi:hypothetical protein
MNIPTIFLAVLLASLGLTAASTFTGASSPALSTTTAPTTGASTDSIMGGGPVL